MNRIVFILIAFVLCLPANAQTVAAEPAGLAHGSVTTMETAAESTTEAAKPEEPDRLADDFVKVSLVIAEPGDVLYSILGHACLHLQCPYYDLDYIYSYESEEVRGRVGRFLLNDLKMSLYAIPIDEYLADYAAEGRGVKEYTVNLSPDVKQRLWQVMDETMMRDQNLPYDCVTRGCAISTFHFLQKALGDIQMEFPVWDKSFDRTLREVFYDNAPKGWQLFYDMTLVGGVVDNPNLPKTEKLIAPRFLLSTLQQTTVEGKQLVSEEAHELLPIVNEYKGDRFTPLHASLLILFLAIGSLFWSRPYIDWAILALQTLLGLLMVWLFFLPMAGTGWSWLIIPFNPLPALFWHWRRYWALPYAVLLLVWIIGMLCAPHRLVEYAHIIGVFAFVLVLLKQGWYIGKINVKKVLKNKD